MEFEDYTKIINSIKEIETCGKLPKEKQKINKFAIKNNEMVLEEIEKSKFAQINDKRYYFSDGIVSLPFSHPFFARNCQVSEGKNKKLKHFYYRKNIKFRWKYLQSKKRILIYRSILQQKLTFYHLNSLKRSAENSENINFSQNLRSYILNSFWK